MPHVSRFQKQSVFNLSGSRFDAAAALGSEDHQLGGVLPRATFLNMLGVASRVPSFSTIVRVSFADHPQAVFFGVAFARCGGIVRARLICAN